MQKKGAFTAVIIGCLQIALLGCGPAINETDVKTVSVIDGDTLQIKGKRIELFGIDAPELGQTCHSSGVDKRCGLDAAYELRKMVSLMMVENHIACQTINRTPSGHVSICKIGKSDLAFRMLEDGLVVTKAGAPKAYVEAERAARQEHLGLWHEEFVKPALWRQRAVERREREGENPQCVLLGITAQAKKKLYFSPLDKAYASLAEGPNPDARWFCSDDEAVRLGWRHNGTVPNQGLNSEDLPSPANVEADEAGRTLRPITPAT